MNIAKESEIQNPKFDKKIYGGYYIKARQIKHSWIAQSAPVVREVWDYLIREANHKDMKYKGFLLHRGQLFRSYLEIRNSLAWNIGYRKAKYSANQMKHAMRLLKKNSMIKLTKKPRGCIITLINYDIYQNPANYESSTEQYTNNPMSKLSNNQLPPSINKKDKNEEKKKYSSEVTDIVNSFHSYLLKSDYCEYKSVKKWKKIKQCEAIEKLYRIDNFSFEIIREGLEFVKQDDFWSKQVQSLNTLRNKGKNGNTKFENILIAMKQNNQKDINELTRNIVE